MNNPFWSDCCDAVVDGIQGILEQMEAQHQVDVLSDQMALNASLQQFNESMRWEQMDSLRSRI